MRAAQGLNETVGPVYVLLMKPRSYSRMRKTKIDPLFKSETREMTLNLNLNLNLFKRSFVIRYTSTKRREEFKTALRSTDWHLSR